MSGDSPIFIHSLFRSASTYFFLKFRELGAGFTCYQEPFNEALVALNRPWRQHRLLEMPLTSHLLRHPTLDLPYFYEFWAARELLGGLFQPRFSYQEYFLSEESVLPADQIRWLSALIDCAPGRAVLQCCRSSGRAAAMRRHFGGWHVHLWREPRAQWWSYQIAEYFETANRRIYECPQLPAALRSVAGRARAPSVRLAPQTSYRRFYGLWLDAWLTLKRQCDPELSINLDEAAVSAAANAAYSRRLSDVAGRRIGLGDLRPIGMVFTTGEDAFYDAAEAQVHAAFLAAGVFSKGELIHAIAQAREARGMHRQRAHDATTEQSLRSAAVVLMRRLAGEDRPGRRRWPARWYPTRLREYLRWRRQPRHGGPVSVSPEPSPGGAREPRIRRSA